MAQDVRSGVGRGWDVVHYLADWGWRAGIEKYVARGGDLLALTRDDYVAGGGGGGVQLALAIEGGQTALEICKDPDVRAFLRHRIAAVGASAMPKRAPCWNSAGCQKGDGDPHSAAPLLSSDADDLPSDNCNAPALQSRDDVILESSAGMLEDHEEDHLPREKRQALSTARVRHRVEERFWAMLHGYLRRAEALVPDLQGAFITKVAEYFAPELADQHLPRVPDHRASAAGPVGEQAFPDEPCTNSCTHRSSTPNQSSATDTIDAPAISVFRIDAPFIKDYLDNFGDVDRAKKRVNSMDVQSYQVVFTPVLYALVARVLQALNIGAGVWRHSASDRQAKAGLAEHRDDSLWTLNVSRQAAVEGGELVFPQLAAAGGDGSCCREETSGPGGPLVLKQDAYTVLVHKGWLRHEVLPIRAGEKKNVIVWLS